MKPVHLEFGTWSAMPMRPSAAGHAASGARQLVAGAALFCMGSLFAWLLASHGAARWELARLTEAWLAIEGRREQPVRRPDPPMTAQQKAAWASLAANLNASWATLFNALEASASAEVTILAIESVAPGAGVRLHAEAASLDALLAYATRLSAHPSVIGLVPMRHETQEAAAGRPVRMTVAFTLVHAQASALGVSR